MRAILVYGLASLIFGYSSAPAWGDEPVPSPSPETHSTQQGKRGKHDSTRKGKIRREKDAEGTKAPNRFDADINTKSKYHYGGQPLEVDTD